MSRNTVYSLVVFLLVAFYFLLALLTSVLMGLVAPREVPVLLLPLFLVGTVSAVIFYFGYTKLAQMVASLEWNASRYTPGRPFFVIVAVLLTLSSALGAFVSYKQGREKKALADRQAAQLEQQRVARAKVAEAEKKRVAALSPEQRAAEVKERQDRVEAAAKAATEAAARKKAEQDAVLAKKMKRDSQLQTAGAGALMLKRVAKDPETFELRSAYVLPNGTACYEYRAKNSFGAILPGKAVLTTTGKMLVQEHDGNTFVGAWNKNCTVSGGDDIAPLLRQIGLLERG